MMTTGVVGSEAIKAQMAKEEKYFRVKAGETHQIAFAGPAEYNRREFPGETPGTKETVWKHEQHVFIPSLQQVKLWTISKTVWRVLDGKLERMGPERFYGTLWTVARQGAGIDDTHYDFDALETLSEEQVEDIDRCLQEYKANRNSDEPF